VFLTCRAPHGPIWADLVGDVVERACQRAGSPKVGPHRLRHCCVMSLLQAGVDTTVIALWLGHAGVRSTDAYVHADMTIKEKALALTAPVTAQPGRYRPTDKVLAFLDRL
jgi:integrase